MTADSPEQVGREHEQVLPGQHEQLARCWAHGTPDLSQQTQCLHNKAFSLALMMQPHDYDHGCPLGYNPGLETVLWFNTVHAAATADYPKLSLHDVYCVRLQS